MQKAKLSQNEMEAKMAKNDTAVAISLLLNQERVCLRDFSIAM